MCVVWLKTSTISDCYRYGVVGTGVRTRILILLGKLSHGNYTMRYQRSISASTRGSDDTILAGKLSSCRGPL